MRLPQQTTTTTETRERDNVEMTPPSLFVFTTTPHKTLFRLLLIFSYFLHPSSAVVNFKDNSLSILIDDSPARFGVRVESPGVCGALYVSDPLDGCTLPWNASRSDGARLALIERGGCDFAVKVRNAQESGFAAVIVYNNVDEEGLINMVGDSEGILVNAVFVSKASGETLKKLAGEKEGECCLLPSLWESAANVFMISFITVLVIVALAGIVFCTRNLVARQQGGHRHTDSHTVEVLPCFTFSVSRQIDQRARETCAICLEDYKEGEKLKVLPCQHEFHAACIDSWLTKWGTFCPVCKRVINRPMRPTV